MKLVITKRLLGIPVKVIVVELPDVLVSVSVTATVGADGGRDIPLPPATCHLPPEGKADVR